MKKIQIVLISIIFAFTGVLYSCAEDTSADDNTDSVRVEQGQDVTNENETVQDDTTTVNNDTKVNVAKYICPNRCDGSNSDNPGNCPVCGMELIENPDL